MSITPFDSFDHHILHLWGIGELCCKASLPYSQHHVHTETEISL